MDYDINNDQLNSNNIKEKTLNIWYNYKKYVIISACILIMLIIVLILTIKPNQKSNNYSDIERIMILNAQNYIKNNNINGNAYVSLNHLNIKIDEKLNCDIMSGVYKEANTYSPYLICDNYNSKTIIDVIDENKEVKEYAELVGSNPYIISKSEYHELGTKSKDNYQINVKNNDIDDGLNIVTYYINDNGKNIGELKRIVIAEDIEGITPTLTLFGEKTKSMPQGSKYSEQGYKAIDEKDGNITDKVKVTGSVNTTKAGTYKITYSVTNSRGKTSTETRTIVVNERENIDLNISHTLDPTTTTKKSVTITVSIKGSGYKYTVSPDNSENTSSTVNYIVYKNGTYDFIVYDKNNNSEVYSVKVSNIDTTPPYPTITSVDHKAAVVTINAKKNKYDIVGYYFSKTNTKPTGKEMTWVEKTGTTFKVAKIPGTYYVFVKDTQNNISPSKEIKITAEDLYNDGPVSGRRENQLNMPLQTLLANKNDTIQNYNDFIAESVKSAGLFTRDGIATAAVAITNYLYDNYHYQIPYISNVKCATVRYNDYFGVNPKMGNLAVQPAGENCKGTYVGFDCTAFVGWAIHNAGYIAENTGGSYIACGRKPCADRIYSCASWDKNECTAIASKNTAYAMYDKLEIGDLIYNSGHIVMFLEFYDENKDGKNDGAYIYESITPAGINKFSFEYLHRKQYYAVVKMQQYMDNPANKTCYGGSTDITLPKSWENYKSQFNICTK